MYTFSSVLFDRLVHPSPGGQHILGAEKLHPLDSAVAFHRCSLDSLGNAVGISLQSTLTSGDSMGPYDPKPLDDIQLWCAKLPTVNGSVNAWCSFFSLIEWSFGSVSVDFARLVSYIQARCLLHPLFEPL